MWHNWLTIIHIFNIHSAHVNVSQQSARIATERSSCYNYHMTERDNVSRCPNITWAVFI